MKNYYYGYQLLKAKADYHFTCAATLTNAMDNETDLEEKKRLCARRSHHRRLYRKYEAMAENFWFTGGKE